MVQLSITERNNIKAVINASYNKLYSQFMSNELAEVGNYRILHQIAEGSFGKVYLACHKPSHRKVVLKSSDKNDANVVREVFYHRQFEFPFITRLYEVIVTENKVWMALEYCPGKELYDHLLKLQRIPIKDCSLMFAQISSALYYAHSLNCVHRDLKLENILLDKDGNTKLTDFGFTRECASKNILETVCGTTVYMAPELIKREKYDGFKTDIWSLGVILYTLLNGYMPFDEDDQIKTEWKIINEMPNFDKNILNDDAIDLLTKLLDKDPIKRPNMKEILQHPFLQPNGIQMLKNCNSILSKQRNHHNKFNSKTEKKLLKKLRQTGYDTQTIKYSIQKRKCDSLSGTWLLLLEKEKQKRNHNNNKNLNTPKRSKSVISLKRVLDGANHSREFFQSKTSLLSNTSLELAAKKSYSLVDKSISNNNNKKLKQNDSLIHNDDDDDDNQLLLLHNPDDLIQNNNLLLPNDNKNKNISVELSQNENKSKTLTSSISTTDNNNKTNSNSTISKYSKIENHSSNNKSLKYNNRTDSDINITNKNSTTNKKNNSNCNNNNSSNTHSRNNNNSKNDTPNNIQNNNNKHSNNNNSSNTNINNKFHRPHTTIRASTTSELSTFSNQDHNSQHKINEQKSNIFSRVQNFFKHKREKSRIQYKQYGNGNTSNNGHATNNLNNNSNSSATLKFDSKTALAITHTNTRLSSDSSNSAKKSGSSNPTNRNYSKENERQKSSTKLQKKRSTISDSSESIDEPSAISSFKINNKENLDPQVSIKGRQNSSSNKNSDRPRLKKFKSIASSDFSIQTSTGGEYDSESTSKMRYLVADNIHSLPAIRQLSNISQQSNDTYASDYSTEYFTSPKCTETPRFHPTPTKSLSFDASQIQNTSIARLRRDRSVISSASSNSEYSSRNGSFYDLATATAPFSGVNKLNRSYGKEVAINKFDTQRSWLPTGGGVRRTPLIRRRTTNRLLPLNSSSQFVIQEELSSSDTDIKVSSEQILESNRISYAKTQFKHSIIGAETEMASKSASALLLHLKPEPLLESYIPYQGLYDESEWENFDEREEDIKSAGSKADDESSFYSPAPQVVDTM